MPLKEAGTAELSLGAIADGEVLKRVGSNIVGATPSAGGLPAGLIAMWHGLLANIPSGWALCDGQNGTPDLRDKFVKGAAAAAEPGSTGGALTHTHTDHAALVHAGSAVADHAAHTHAYSEIVNHTHPVTDPGHNHTQDAHTHIQNAHSHGMAEGTTDGSGTFMDRSNAAAATTASTDAATAVNQNATATNQSNTTGITTSNPVGGVASGTTGNPSATLSHGVTQPNNHAAQSHNSPNHEPPFYALAFIMKT